MQFGDEFPYFNSRLHFKILFMEGQSSLLFLIGTSASAYPASPNSGKQAAVCPDRGRSMTCPKAIAHVNVR